MDFDRSTQPDDCSPGPVMRRLVDGEGRRWRVWLADTRAVPGAPRGECLILDGTEVVRRIWNVPAGWEALPADALLGLVERGGERAVDIPVTREGGAGR